MAYVEDWTCRECGKPQHAMRPSNDVCGVCTEKQREQRKKEHFDKLDKMTIEQRLRLIENHLYADPDDFSRGWDSHNRDILDI